MIKRLRARRRPPMAISGIEVDVPYRAWPPVTIRARRASASVDTSREPARA